MGDYYHDPSIPENEITWQYCVVDIDRKLPDIEYELLYEVFIPSDIEYDKEKSLSYSSEFLDKLENESLRITGNYEINKTEKASSKWTPSGKILFYDNVLDKKLPLEGVRVVVNYFTDDAEGQTNINGEFSVDEKFKTKHKVNCKIKWENKHWDIRSGKAGQAYYDGGKLSSSDQFNVTFNQGDGIQYNYANTHRACYEYFYYAYKYGLTPPPANTFWNAALKIAVMNETDDKINATTQAWKRVFGVLNTIKIYNPNLQVYEYYSTVIHELAHYAHWGFDKSTYNSHTDKNNTLIVAESWASGVQWVITKSLYSNYIRSYSRRDYTGVVQDMIDGFVYKSCDYHSKFKINSFKGYFDEVQGYNLQQIEKALRNAKTFNNWRDNLKNLYSNETENNLDETFSYWAD